MMIPRIGHGYDVHALQDGLRLVICGVEIEHSKGFIAHSDGDVALHALCDALLGAAALGDIGYHFPDTSDAFKGIDSMILLQKVVEILSINGYVIGNIDITIIAERPKVKPFILQMRGRIASALELSLDQVSIKATTTEKLGFVGREEGIASDAVVLIYKKTELK